MSAWISVCHLKIYRKQTILYQWKDMVKSLINLPVYSWTPLCFHPLIQKCNWAELDWMQTCPTHSKTPTMSTGTDVRPFISIHTLPNFWETNVHSWVGSTHLLPRSLALPGMSAPIHRYIVYTLWYTHYLVLSTVTYTMAWWGWPGGAHSNGSGASD